MPSVFNFNFHFDWAHFFEFKKRHIITPQCGSSKLVKDLPNFTKQTILYSLATHTDITENLIDNALIGGLGGSLRPNGYMAYARNYFTDGVPTGTIKGAALDPTKVSLFLNKYFPLVDAYEYLIESSSFDVLHKEEIALAYNPYPGVPIDSIVVTNYSIVDEYTLRIDYHNNLDNTNKTVDVLLPYPVGFDYMYYYIEYYVVNKQTQHALPDSKRSIVVWSDDPRYPELHIDEGHLFTEYMPIVPIRINKKTLIDPSYSQTDLYKTSEKLLSRLGVKIEDVFKAIDSNPQIKDVYHVYLLNGIDLLGDNTEEELEYLYHFFNDLANRSVHGKDNFDFWFRLYREKIPFNPFGNSIEIISDTYKTSLCYYYITVDLKDGKYVEVDKVHKEIVRRPPVQIKDPRTGNVIGERPSNKSGLLLRYQVNESQYIEVFVAGLFYVSFIAGIDETLMIHVSTNNKTDQMIVPVDLDIVKRIKGIKARNDFLFGSIRLAYKSWTVTSLNWWEDPLILKDIAIVGVVINVATGNYIGAAISIAALMGLDSSGIAQFILHNSYINPSYKVFQYLEKQWGKENLYKVLIAIQLLATLSGIFAKSDDASLAISGTEQLSGDLSNQALSDLENEYLESAQFYQKQYEAFNKELEEFRKVNHLDPTELINLYRYIIDSNILHNESINDHVVRTTNDRSSIELSLELSSNYIDYSLDTDITLPIFSTN